MARDTESTPFTSLPLISVLDSKTMKKAKLLLEELAQLDEYIEMYESRRKEIVGYSDKGKDFPGELEVIQQAAGLPGLKFGRLCYRVSEQAGRRSIDRGLLMENGVRAEVIEASMKEGSPYKRREFKVVPE